MKHKYLIILILLLFTVNVDLKINAQSIIIKSKDGIEDIEPISAVQNFTLSENNLLVKLINGQTDLYALSTIGTLCFKDVPITSIKELKVKEGIFFYPNPASENIVIENLPEGNSIISVYQVDGIMILNSIIPKSSNHINISELKSGFYLLKINNQVFKFRKI